MPSTVELRFYEYTITYQILSIVFNVPDTSTHHPTPHRRHQASGKTTDCFQFQIDDTITLMPEKQTFSMQNGRHCALQLNNQKSLSLQCLSASQYKNAMWILIAADPPVATEYANSKITIKMRLAISTNAEQHLHRR